MGQIQLISAEMFPVWKLAWIGVTLFQNDLVMYLGMQTWTEGTFGKQI